MWYTDPQTFLLLFPIVHCVIGEIDVKAKFIFNHGVQIKMRNYINFVLIFVYIFLFLQLILVRQFCQVFLSPSPFLKDEKIF